MTLSLVKPNLTPAQEFAAALLGESPEDYARNERIAELRVEIDAHERQFGKPSTGEVSKLHIELARLILTFPSKARVPLPEGAQRLGLYVADNGDIGFKVD